MRLARDGILTPKAVVPWALEWYPPVLIPVQTYYGRMLFVAVAKEMSALNGVWRGCFNFLSLQLRGAVISRRNHRMLPLESQATPCSFHASNPRLDLYRVFSLQSYLCLWTVLIHVHLFGLTLMVQNSWSFNGHPALGRVVGCSKHWCSAWLLPLKLFNHRLAVWRTSPLASPSW